MTVWVATAQVDYEDYHVIGVYSSESLARKAANRFLVALADSDWGKMYPDRAKVARLGGNVQGFAITLELMTVDADNPAEDL